MKPKGVCEKHPDFYISRSASECEECILCVGIPVLMTVLLSTVIHMDWNTNVNECVSFGSRMTA